MRKKDSTGQPLPRPKASTDLITDSIFAELSAAPALECLNGLTDQNRPPLQFPRYSAILAQALGHLFLRRKVASPTDCGTAAPRKQIRRCHMDA